MDDLIPAELDPNRFRALFIGESPHRDEVAPESNLERSPFRGVAGREWWSELSKFLQPPLASRIVPARVVLMEICTELRIGVMNAVQFPIDPKITLHQGDTSSPRVQLGFEKGSGEFSYKAGLKQPDGPVAAALANLSERLAPFEESSVKIICLGGDSRWFTQRALERLPKSAKIRQGEIEQIPHPSSWWRNASYRARAVERLRVLFS